MSMTAEEILSQIESMETQLKVLKEQARQLQASASAQSPLPPKRFCDLAGILAGQVSSSEADIDAVLYRFDWVDEEAEEAQS